MRNPYIFIIKKNIDVIPLIEIEERFSTLKGNKFFDTTEFEKLYEYYTQFLNDLDTKAFPLEEINSIPLKKLSVEARTNFITFSYHFQSSIKKFMKLLQHELIDSSSYSWMQVLLSLYYHYDTHLSNIDIHEFIMFIRSKDGFMCG